MDDYCIYLAFRPKYEHVRDTDREVENLACVAPLIYLNLFETSRQRVRTKRSCCTTFKCKNQTFRIFRIMRSGALCVDCYATIAIQLAYTYCRSAVVAPANRTLVRRLSARCLRVTQLRRAVTRPIRVSSHLHRHWIGYLSHWRFAHVEFNENNNSKLCDPNRISLFHFVSTQRDLAMWIFWVF